MQLIRLFKAGENLWFLLKLESRLLSPECPKVLLMKTRFTHVHSRTPRTSLAAICLACFCFSLPQMVISQDDQRAVFEKIVENQEARERTYDTGHFVWLQRESYASGEEEVTRFEYWALDGEYYRFETSVMDTDSPETFVKGNTVIVRPEGFALIDNKDIRQLGAIISVGSFDDGKARIFGAEPMMIADRIGRSFLKPYIELRDLHPEVNLSLKENPDGTFSLSFSDPHPEGTLYKNAILDGEDYRILSWEYRARGSDGVRKCDQIANYRYDRDQHHTPIEVEDKVEANYEVNRIGANLKLVEFDLNPPPIEMFGSPGHDFSSGTASSVWMRRLILLACGVMMVAVYYAFRRRTPKT